MGRYIIRRSLFAIPTLLAISLIIFGILDLAPGDPTSQLPLNVPVEVRDRIRESLGFDDPLLVKYTKWLKLMVVNEPVNTINSIFGTCFGNCEEPDRIISWSSRTPAFDIIIERVPQTVWVLGIAFVIGIVLAIPIGVISAYKQYSAFDNTGTFVLIDDQGIGLRDAGALLGLSYERVRQLHSSEAAGVAPRPGGTVVPIVSSDEL